MYYFFISIPFSYFMIKWIGYVIYVYLTFFDGEISILSVFLCPKR